MKFDYLICCVDCGDGDAINAMADSAREIQYSTFVKHCNWKPWARTLGYQVGPGPELRLKAAWHVRYFKSTWGGKPCFYAKHSSIEHIFTEQAKPAPIRRPW